FALNGTHSMRRVSRIVDVVVTAHQGMFKVTKIAAAALLIFAEKIVAQEAGDAGALFAGAIRSQISRTRDALSLARIEFDRRPKDIGEGFIERCRFERVNQWMITIDAQSLFKQPVRNLMSDNIDGRPGQRGGGAG